MPKWGVGSVFVEEPPVHLPKRTREDGEVFLTRPKTSHKKSGNFSAEVGKVLCRSRQSSLQKSAKFSAEVEKLLWRVVFSGFFYYLCEKELRFHGTISQHL